MSSYKEPPIVTAYGIQKDVTEPARFIHDSFDAPEVTIVGFCGKWDSARAHLQAWLIGDVATGMKRTEATWSSVRYYQTLQRQGHGPPISINIVDC